MITEFSKKLNNLVINMRAKGFFHLLSANFLINLLGFGAQLIIVKLLSPIDLGRIITLQSFIALAVILAGFGFNTAVLKLCSENKGLDEKKNILKANLKFTSVTVAVTVLVITGLAFKGYFSPDRAINRLMLLFMFYIPGAVFTSLFICYLQALKKIQLISYAQVILRFLAALSLIIFTYYWKLAGFISSSFLFGVIGLILFFRLLDINLKFKPVPSGILKISLYYGKWSAAYNGLNALGASMDIFLLNYLVKDRVILGDYGLATVFVFAMNQITGTVQAIATPYFSEKNQDRVEFMRVLNKYQRLLVMVSAGVFLIAVFFVPWFIKLAYPGKYQMGGVFFKFLAMRYLFWSCYALFNVALIGMGRMKDSFLASSISIPIAVVLSLLLITLYGPIGAAYAQAIAGFCAMVIVYLNFKRAIADHFKLHSENLPGL